MNIVRQRTGADSAYKQNLYGSGIGIAVLDSGIYPHPDFMNHGSRITAFRDFVNHRQTPYDDNGHGTHIAGIIAGSGYLSEGKYMGMAPRAHLIILKILDSKGNGTAETVCRAIEWTVRNRSRFHIHILNISIGAKAGEETTESRMLIDAAEYAWDRGLTVVAAAGNNGRLGSVIPGTSKRLAVSTAHMQSGTPSSSLFSGRGPTRTCICKPEILAPGFRICSCGHLPAHPYAIRSGIPWPPRLSAEESP
ncbi:MAG: S8 family serine peptidase [Coprococcus sp.]